MNIQINQPSKGGGGGGTRLSRGGWPGKGGACGDGEWVVSVVMAAMVAVRWWCSAVVWQRLEMVVVEVETKVVMVVVVA
ncbi:hypothetical protein Tco_1374806 [Tanacetum coccineum]